MDDSTTKITIDLETQLSRLTQLADMVNFELEHSGGGIPARAEICMTQLAGSLIRFGKQVRRHDEAFGQELKGRLTSLCCRTLAGSSLAAMAE